MRGLLVCPIAIDFPGNRGIVNKMEYQRAAFAELAGGMDAVCSSRSGLVFNGELVAPYPIAGRGLSAINHYGLFYGYVWKHCKPADYDFLYIRYPFAIPSFLIFLAMTKRVSTGTRIIVEIPTFPYRQELLSPKQRVLLALDDLGRSRLKDYVDVVVTFFGQTEIYGIPCINSANGVDLDRVSLRAEHTPTDHLRIIAVANLARWHGLDRILRGLAEYQERDGQSPVTLDIVGTGPEESHLQALTAELALQETVRFHGVKTGPELDGLFSNTGLALGSLGMHRLGLHTSSSLKAREYCARGIPFVLASDDPDFPRDTPFVHQVPADERPVDIAALVAFVKGLRRTNPEHVAQMREYAEEKLTWKAKLEPVLRYLRTGELVNGT